MTWLTNNRIIYNYVNRDSIRQRLRYGSARSIFPMQPLKNRKKQMRASSIGSVCTYIGCNNCFLKRGIYPVNRVHTKRMWTPTRPVLVEPSAIDSRLAYATKPDVDDQDIVTWMFLAIFSAAAPAFLSARILLILTPTSTIGRAVSRYNGWRVQTKASVHAPVRRQSITELLESGGFDWAVRAIYQINRGGSDSRRMMGPMWRASRAPYVRKWPGVGVQRSRPAGLESETRRQQRV